MQILAITSKSTLFKKEPKIYINSLALITKKRYNYDLVMNFRTRVKCKRYVRKSDDKSKKRIRAEFFKR